MYNPQEISFDEFVSTYQPIKASDDSFYFDTSDETVKAAMQDNPNTVWTYVSGTGDAIISGKRFVNRIAYLITKVPFDADIEIDMEN